MFSSVSRPLLRRFLYSAVFLTVGGCIRVGPVYHAPQAWTPPHYDTHNQSKGQESPTSKVTETPISDIWWRQFHDPELVSLEERIATQNLSFLLSTANLAQSRAQMLVAGAERFPTLSAQGSYQRSQHSTEQLREIVRRVGRRIPSNKGDLLGNSDDVHVPLLNQWQDEIDARYEIDLWGRVAHQYEAAKAVMQMSEEERRSVLIAQQADMARDYLQLRGDQRRYRILEQNRATLSQLLDLTTSRYRSGLVTELDVDSVRARLHDVQAEEESLDQSIAQEMNAIALLLGAPPQSLNTELQKTADVPVIPPTVPIGIPSELAHRRPDIREAEARLRETVAEVGQATADFYPKVTITADFGVQSLSFRDLGWSSRAWDVGPTISLPIFQGGRLYGQLKLKKAAQKAAAISYRQTVLQAWNEVDNALQAYHNEQNRQIRLKETVADNQRALDLATSQYRSGLSTYLNVLEAQTNLQTSQLDLTGSDATLATNLARLYNVLGGGWKEDLPEKSLH
ncbi:efflux transporter outer membrane subunit [Saccharibacter sp. 17.LH.SD]|nr:efflux transporter outer membrane subunit [Saccharibacter sp. 17.LH.SD]MXV44916.1 efflux transporter outer membrane subunit [Saccharibacter sp. 17.LH.SD]